MSISSKIIITWTPSPSAFTQSVQRAPTSGGAWSTIASGLAAGVSSYEDTTTVDNPFTTYYYRILTFCDAESEAIVGTVVSATSGNCPSVNTNTFFGLYSTNGGLATSFNYYDRISEIYSFTPGKTVTSPAGKVRVVCHKCGQTVQPTGASAQHGDVSFLDFQDLNQFLPVSSAALGGSQNNYRGTVYRKVKFSSTIIDNGAAHFGSGSGNTFTQVTLTSGTYTFKSHTQLRLGRYIFNTTTDQTTGLNALSNTNLYVAISNDDVNVKGCEIYIYQVIKNSNLNITVGGSIMLGFNLTYVSSHVINGNYAIFSVIDTPTYSFNLQPNMYFKFFNL